MVSSLNARGMENLCLYCHPSNNQLNNQLDNINYKIKNLFDKQINLRNDLEKEKRSIDFFYNLLCKEIYLLDQDIRIALQEKLSICLFIMKEDYKKNKISSFLTEEINKVICSLDFFLVYHFKNYPQDVDLILYLNKTFYHVKGMGLCADGTLNGTGTFGRVFIGHEESTGKKVAIKVAEPPPYMGKESLENEAALLKKVYGFQNVVGAFHTEIVESRGKAVMVAVMPQIEHAEELFDAYKRLDKSEKYAVLIDGAYALYQCHDNGVIHRDVKPENFLYERSEKSSHLHLIDFGFAREFGDNKPDIIEFGGTPEFLAPEVIQREKQTDKTDVYSFGVMIHEILGENRLDGSKDRDTLFSKRLSRDGLASFEKEELERQGIDAEVIELVSNCVKRDPNERPKMCDVFRNLKRAFAPEKKEGKLGEGKENVNIASFL